ELLNLLWLKDQARQRHEEEEEREQREHAKERDRSGDVHQLVLDETLFQSEEELLPGHPIGWREHERPLRRSLRLNMERLSVSRIVTRTSACPLACQVLTRAAATEWKDSVVNCGARARASLLA